MNGTINGNLIAIGAQMTINGEINGSLVFAGQIMVIKGKVNGTIYAAGNSIILAPGAVIQRNVFWAGFAIQSSPESLIKRDLMVAGYQLELDGEVGRNVAGDLAALEISGKVGQDVTVDVAAPGTDERIFYSMPFFQSPGTPPALDSGLRVQENAQIGGKLSYTSPLDQSSAIQAQPGGGVAFTLRQDNTGKVKQTVEQQITSWIIARFRELVTLIILAGLAAWLLPGLLRRASEQARLQPLPSFGWGFLTLIGGFFVALILAVLIVLVGLLTSVVSLGGLSSAVFGIGFSGLGLALALFMLAIDYGSKLVVAHLGGKWLLGRLQPPASESRVWPLLIGVLIYIVLRSIPVLGFLVGLAATLLGLGAIWLALRARPTAISQAINQ